MKSQWTNVFPANLNAIFSILSLARILHLLNIHPQNMAYNLHSLLHTLEQILEHPHPQLCIHDQDKTQLPCLLEKATTLKNILENFSPAAYKPIETQVRDAAYKAEDMIELAIADQILMKLRCESSIQDSCKLTNLQQVIDEFDEMINEAQRTVEDPTSKSISTSVTYTPDLNPQNIVVGLEKDIIQLKGWLTGQEPDLEVISIVGMGGIGKTTLAQTLYRDPLITSHFYRCGWATISQDYSISEIFFSLACCIIGKEEVEHQLNRGKELEQIVYQSLIATRYLIVLDDIWDASVWKELRRFLPPSSGSRIILTTRVVDVANDASPKKEHHEMRLLSEEESWELFCVKVFGKEECPSQLEEMGRNITNNCKGLPLAIQVISGVLSESHEEKGLWERVANDINETASLKDEHFMRIFSLSYDNMPYYLRPCLLYIGALPEDSEIRVSKIIRLWAAEGFLKPIEGKTSEEAAKVYLNDLANRNLLLVREWKSNGKVKSYGIHDLIRDLCMKRGDLEKFIVCGVKSLEARRVTFKGTGFDEHLANNFTNLRTLICVASTYKGNIGSFSRLLKASRLVRVFEAPKIDFHNAFPEEILQLVNIRYLSLQCSSLPSAIFQLWNLESLTISPSADIDIPSEICDLQNLRHFQLSIGRVGNIQTLHSILVKLETLSFVHATRNLIESIPNITDLGMNLNESNMDELDLSNMHALQNLKLVGYVNVKPLSVIFPELIERLTLSDGHLNKELMKMIGSLRNLKVLRMRPCILTGGTEWETCEGAFESLQFLELGIYNLVEWITNEYHFPQLRHLVVRCCLQLKEIPSCIGEIETLQRIDVYRDSKSAVVSAREIQEEQLELGNNGIQVCLFNR